MFTWHAKYKDFNGTQREEDFLFHLTEADLTEMELSTNGGLDQYINRIVAAQDGAEIIKLFKELVCKAYGIKSLDGKGFYKDEKSLRDFMATQAYSDLYMKLATDTDFATKFVNGIVPQDVSSIPQDHKKPEHTNK